MSSIAPETFGPLCDATLMSFGWEQDGRDLVIRIELAEGPMRRFTFSWVNHLLVSIAQPDNGPSQPFSWEGGAERLSDGRVRVLLDFASQGEISFLCDEITADGT
ncbi:MAG TPA: hypothetical protein VEA69_11655 [Tepidisphaeraceae bacterium]|nr:hypothetical protein [Tepidisphaeraceae bacterium]